MKTLFGLLFILLTTHSGVCFVWNKREKNMNSNAINTLKCYLCTASTSNDECNKNSDECPAPFDVCMNTVVKMGTVKGISKSCSSRMICEGAAAVASVDQNGNGVQISCCTSRLCNYSGAASIKAHRWLMLLPLILMFLLIKQHT